MMKIVFGIIACAVAVFIAALSAVWNMEEVEDGK